MLLAVPGLRSLMFACAIWFLGHLLCPLRLFSGEKRVSILSGASAGRSKREVVLTWALSGLGVLAAIFTVLQTVIEIQDLPDTRDGSQFLVASFIVGVLLALVAGLASWASRQDNPRKINMAAFGTIILIGIFKVF